MSVQPAPAAAPSGGSGASVGALFRDRGAIAAGIVLLTCTALAWVGVGLQAVGMGGAMLPVGPATFGDAAMFTTMWGVMMAAMMLPSAIPMIALYATVTRSMAAAGSGGPRVAPTALFGATYLIVWLLLGAPVYFASVAVAALAGPDASGARWLPYALAAVLAGAGAYQFTSIKRVCLKNCQSPLSFLMDRWRTGYASTLRLGVTHAAYCVGCCWGLMVILVAAGAMSLPWVLAIAAIVFAEKLLPRGEWTARVVGAGLILLGIVVALRPDLALALRGTEMSQTPAISSMPM
jgi:predicted metal-binding membrane protein